MLTENIEALITTSIITTCLNFTPMVLVYFPIYIVSQERLKNKGIIVRNVKYDLLCVVGTMVEVNYGYLYREREGGKIEPASDEKYGGAKWPNQLLIF